MHVDASWARAALPFSAAFISQFSILDISTFFLGCFNRSIEAKNSAQKYHIKKKLTKSWVFLCIHASHSFEKRSNCMPSDHSISRTSSRAFNVSSSAPSSSRTIAEEKKFQIISIYTAYGYTDNTKTLYDHSSKTILTYTPMRCRCFRKKISIWTYTL